MTTNQTGDQSNKVCPNCGYCPHCGRSSYGMYPWSYPTLQPTWIAAAGGSTSPTYPTYTNTPTYYTVTVTSGASN